MNWVMLKQAGRMEVSADDRNNTITIASYLLPNSNYGFKPIQSAFKDVTSLGDILDRKLEQGELDVHADPAKMYPDEGRISVTLHLTLGVTKARKEQFFDALEEARIGYKRKYF